MHCQYCGDGDDGDHDMCMLMSRSWRSMDTAPKDGTVIRLLIYHRNREYAKGLAKAEWEQSVEGTWIDFNGSGWTWHGICGEPQGWLPLPANQKISGGLPSASLES